MCPQHGLSHVLPSGPWQMQMDAALLFRALPSGRSKIYFHIPARSDFVARTAFADYSKQMSTFHIAELCQFYFSSRTERRLLQCRTTPVLFLIPA